MPGFFFIEPQIVVGRLVTYSLAVSRTGGAMARARPGHNWVKDTSAADRGYRFQFSLTKRIFEKLRGFKTITFKNMNGDVVTKQNHERMGRDGGIDLVIEIEAANRAAGLQVAGKVKKKLKSLGR